MNATSTDNYKPVQALLIALVFVGSLVGAVLAANEVGGLLLLAMVGGGLGLLIFRWKPARILILIASMFIDPLIPNLPILNQVPASMILLAAIVGLWVLENVLKKRPFVVSASMSQRVVFLFGLVAILAFLSGQIPWYPVKGASLGAQLAALAIFLMLIVAFFVAGNVVQNEKWLSWYIWFFLAVAAVAIFGSMVPGLRSVIVRALSVTSGGSIVGVAFVAAATSQALLNPTLAKRYRFVLLTIALGYLAVSFGLNRSWVSGWLPALVAFAVVAWFYQIRLGILTIAMGLLAALFVYTEIGEALVLENSYSLSTRLAALSTVLDIVKVNPLLGVGPANYYWYATIFPLLGFYVQFNSHNQYIDLIAQTGILGLLVFLFLIVQLSALSIRLYRNLEPGFARAYAVGGLAIIAGMVVAGFLGDWVIPFFYNVGLRGFDGAMGGWFLLGGLVLLESKYLLRK